MRWPWQQTFRTRQVTVDVPKVLDIPNWIKVVKQEESYRCSECHEMQKPPTKICWIENGTLLGDPMWSLEERHKKSRWNGQFSGWCSNCVEKLLQKAKED